jgi:hypothetical protein
VILPGLTAQEIEVLDRLASAWNAFAALSRRECSIEDDLTCFAGGIHACQAEIALRVAARINPDVWR